MVLAAGGLGLGYLLALLLLPVFLDPGWSGRGELSVSPAAWAVKETGAGSSGSCQISLSAVRTSTRAHSCARF